MSDFFMMGSIVVAVVNAALATALLGLYGMVYGKTKSAFTLALLIFAAAFLLHNLLAIFSLTTMMPYVPAGLTPYLMGIGLLEGFGLGAMAYTATR